ncbi:MAG: mechanosensitive ion channel domain-containing protein [Pseudomonadota bacterium]|nr:mechanosensitive ion channel domain-containing protein [Pseudomonadota bacterium]
MEELLNFKDVVAAHLTNWAINIGLAVVILTIGWLIVRVVSRFTAKLLKRAGFDAILADFSISIIRIILMIVVLIAVLDRLGVDTTSLIALLGAAGIAIGLALKDSLSNFAAGLMLIVFRPIRAGNYVELGGTAGSVEKINLFTTTLVTPDNREVTVPNGVIYSNTIVNYSARDKRRAEIIVGVSYEDDLHQARKVILEVVNSDDRVLSEPKPMVAVIELGDSSVNLTVRAWTATQDYFMTRLDLTEAIKLALDDAGVTIPYPQLTLHKADSASP